MSCQIAGLWLRYYRGSFDIMEFGINRVSKDIKKMIRKQKL